MGRAFDLYRYFLNTSIKILTFTTYLLGAVRDGIAMRTSVGKLKCFENSLANVRAGPYVEGVKPWTGLTCGTVVVL